MYTTQESKKNIAIVFPQPKLDKAGGYVQGVNLSPESWGRDAPHCESTHYGILFLALGEDDEE